MEISHADARRHVRVLARIKTLDPLLADNCGWTSLWKAGFWQYFIEYRVKSLWRPGWREQCKHEALGEIVGIIDKEVTNIADTAAQLAALLSRSESEIAKLTEVIKSTNRQVSLTNKRGRTMDIIAKPYDALLKQQEEADAQQDDVIPVVSDAKQYYPTAHDDATEEDPPPRYTRACFSDRCVTGTPNVK